MPLSTVAKETIMREREREWRERKRGKIISRYSVEMRSFV